MNERQAQAFPGSAGPTDSEESPPRPPAPWVVAALVVVSALVAGSVILVTAMMAADRIPPTDGKQDAAAIEPAAIPAAVPEGATRDTVPIERDPVMGMLPAQETGRGEQPGSAAVEVPADLGLPEGSRVLFSRSGQGVTQLVLRVPGSRDAVVEALESAGREAGYRIERRPARHDPRNITLALAGPGGSRMMVIRPNGDECVVVVDYPEP